MRKLNINTIVHHYLHCALWTAELDGKYDIDAFGAGEQLYASVRDIGDFLNKSIRHLGPYLEHFGDGTESQLGHDFWLSRNGHGSGFFNCHLGVRDNPELVTAADKLQEIARSFPERNVFESEVGNLFIE